MRQEAQLCYHIQRDTDIILQKNPNLRLSSTGCRVPYDAGQERRLLNDALVFLPPSDNGQVVLTGNTSDFDNLNQLLPTGRILLHGTS